MSIFTLTSNPKTDFKSSVLTALLFSSTVILPINATAADSDIIAIVNDRNITNKMLQQYQKHRGIPNDADPAQQRNVMIGELINRELIYLDALKNKIEKDSDVQYELENQRVNIIVNAMLYKTANAFKITEAELKKTYQQQIAGSGGQEFKARHILLKEEKQAQAIIKELKNDASFIDLAKAKSTGPSNKHGGDLGWFKADQMVKPFTDAVTQLKNGEFSKKPVKTQFGWHVILREDARNLNPPPFDSLKEQIRMRLQNKKIEQYISGLRTHAKITTKDTP